MKEEGKKYFGVEKVCSEEMKETIPSCALILWTARGGGSVKGREQVEEDVNAFASSSDPIDS